MAHNPLKMTIEDAKDETFAAWSRSYSPERNFEAINSIRHAPIDTRVSHLVARLFFRGIYFPQMGKRAWLKLIFDNRRSILSLSREGITTWRQFRRRKRLEVQTVQTNE
ncbi:MAG: hypothetical protein IPK98_11575 [Chloracidobacterium sp.]|nr:hypothetical protein [Chloracidobacterium sp.]